MNQDFILPASPQAARRILALARINKRITVEREIAALAEVDRVPYILGLDDAQRETLQFIVDCQYRSILLTNDETRAMATIVQAALFKQIPLIVVVASRHRHPKKWKVVTDSYRLHLYNAKDDPTTYPEKTLLLIDDNQIMSIISKLRHGLLVIDFLDGSDDLYHDSFAGLCLDFEKVIVVNHIRYLCPTPKIGQVVIEPSPFKDTSIFTAASYLLNSPSLAEALLESVRNMRELVRLGFISSPNVMAPLLNVSTRLITI